jgi:four helix bundle protein
VGTVPASAGYKYLLTYQLATVIYDLTVKFCDRYIDRKLRTYDQMTQAARSGKQNIAEGYLNKSLKGYIYLLGISLGSFGELGEDFEDFLRQKGLTLWGKEDLRVRVFRAVRVVWANPDIPEIPNLPNDPESSANFLLTFVNQEEYILKKRVVQRNQNKW